MVGEFGLGGIPTDVGQFSPDRSPRHSERTRGAGGASKGERSGDRQHLTPAEGRASDEEGREQKAADRAPRRKARKVKPIPIAPRMRRSHFRMIASDPCAAHLGVLPSV